jgi:hypothetical protein
MIIDTSTADRLQPSGLPVTLGWTDQPVTSLFPDPPLPSCEAIVVIPVRDEQETITRTLQSLIDQVQRDGTPLRHDRYEVLLLINNTTDKSAATARRIASEHPTFHLHIAEIDLPGPVAHVGQARRLLMDAAADRLMHLNRPRGVIATTDADTILTPTWVSATIEEVELGSDAVGGRILIAPDDLRTMDRDARACHLRDVGYRSLIALAEVVIDPPPGDPWPRHFQHFGASIALTAETYRRAGGLPVRPALEDVALYDRLVSIDATIRHSPDVRVFTSARFEGRTCFGFAVQLQQWAQMHRRGEPFLVRSAGDIFNEFETRHQLRAHWTSIIDHSTPDDPTQVRLLAKELNIDHLILDDILTEGASFGQVWQEVQNMQRTSGRRSERYPEVEINRAISDLRHLTARWLPMLTRSTPLEYVHPVEILPAIREVS